MMNDEQTPQNDPEEQNPHDDWVEADDLEAPTLLPGNQPRPSTDAEEFDSPTTFPEHDDSDILPDDGDVPDWEEADDLEAPTLLPGADPRPDIPEEEDYDEFEGPTILPGRSSLDDEPDQAEAPGILDNDAFPVPVIPQPIMTETTTQDAQENPQPHRNFEDLTLAEVTGHLFRAPVATFRTLSEIIRTPIWSETPQSTTVPAPIQQKPQNTWALVSIPFFASRHETPTAEPSTWTAERSRELIRLSLYFIAFAVSWYGNNIFISGGMLNRTEGNQLAKGMPYLIVGFFVWIAAEVFYHWDDLRQWVSSRFTTQPESDAHSEQSVIPVSDEIEGELSPTPAQQTGFGDVPMTAMLTGGVVLFSALTWLGTSNNSFTVTGFGAWIISIVLVVTAMMPSNRSWLDAFGWLQKKVQSIRIRVSPTVVALIVIVLFGAYFRLDNFDTVPPEMTSDHVEKLLDAQRVLEGEYNVFFANNGGREPFQMYAMALLSQVPGFGMDHASLQFLAVLEGLITLPLLWWMGREIIGEKDRALGNVVGLTLAALVAASYWHTSITRLALRIVLTPLVTSLLVIYLSRAMRHNRRVDFIITGLILGFGLYTYQAVRMLPVVIVVGIILALIFRARTMKIRSQYVINLAALVLVSAVVFVPLARYWNQFPENFWQRTAGRLLGDDVIYEYDEAGNIVSERNATIQERIEAFGDNMSALANNLRNALLMYNWKGDVAWINGAPNQPAMDPFSGALLIIGLAAWLVWLVKKRDVVLLLIPIMVFLMLLPSALSIAMPIENPSATRTSGSIPPVYLIAGFPLALIALSLRRVINNNLGGVLASFFVVLVVSSAFLVNSGRFFDDFQDSYLNSSLPYSEAGNYLEGFVNSGGAYGNAYVIAYQHWWDHRAVGIEAGIMDYPNGILTREEIPDVLYDRWRCGDNLYRMNPERDLLFFYNQNDVDTDEYLHGLFPEGRSILYDSYQENDDYFIFRAPALTLDGMIRFNDTYVRERRC